MADEASTWEIYLRPLDEGVRAVVGFDVNAAEEEVHDGGKHGRRVVLFLRPERVRANGLPDKEELDRIGRVEERVLDSLRELEIDGRLVGRLTYAGRRELVLQVDDAQGFDEAARQWQELDAQVLDGHGWEFFDEHVRPSPEHWVQIYDRRVIDELVNAGTDPRRVHLLEFTFRGLPPLLEPVARILEAHNFRVTPYRPDTLIVREPCRLDLDRIWSLSSEFKRLADNRGVQYEGWGTGVMPPPDPSPKDELLTYSDDGTPCLHLCPACLTQIDPAARQCPVCGRALEQDELEYLAIDEYALEPRMKCPSCRQIKLARATICPHCLHR